jgi:Tfp pilus assembly pilus retraction ATPase PilT
MSATPLLYSYLDQAMTEGASDITLCPGEPLTFRIHRKLRRYGVVPREAFNELLWDIVNHDVGSISHKGERFRFIHYRSEDGPVLELRHLAKSVPLLSDLSPPPAFQELIGSDHGLIIDRGGKIDHAGSGNRLYQPDARRPQNHHARTSD